MANLIKTLKKGADFIFPKTTASAVFDSSNRTVQSVINLLENGKLNLYQGTENVGKTLVVGADGYLTLVAGARLPDAYQEVKYIQSSGSSSEANMPYINTGISGEYVAELDIEAVSFGVSFGMFIGQSSSGGNYAANTSTSFTLGGGISMNATPTTRQTVAVSKTSSGLTLNAGGASITRSGTTSASNVCLFGVSGSLTSNYYGSNKIYSAKFTQNGSVVREFVPCYRKSDSVIGMYDLTNGVFYTNAGSGSFTKGSNV